MNKFKKSVIVYTVFIASLLNIYCIIAEYAVSLPDAGHYAAICNLLKKYTRPITVLEIGVKSVRYTFNIASQLENATCVALLLESGACEIASTAAAHKYHNITVLSPTKVSPETFMLLSKCEHFDVVIIQDLQQVLKGSEKNYLEYLLFLGDYIFIEMDPKSRRFQKCIKHKQYRTLSENRKGQKLVFFDIQKKGLSLARWTQRKVDPKVKFKYQVYSTFNQKLLLKKDIKEPTNWIPGINLVTFVMLQGIYPTDAMIANYLTQMRQLEPPHNDLVIGNIVVKGDELIPIDINDIRRNADMQKCLDAAFTVFNGDGSRFSNPKKKMTDYYKLL